MTKQNLLDLVYPIGSVYMSNSSQSPVDLFGGTWKELYRYYEEDTQGSVSSLELAFLSHSENASNADLGSFTIYHMDGTHNHTVTTNTISTLTIPINSNHLHYQTYKTGQFAKNTSGSYDVTRGYASTYSTGFYTDNADSHTHTMPAHTHEITIANTGGTNIEFNNVPPYVVVKTWVRTA